MGTPAKHTAATIISSLRYRDALAMTGCRDPEAHPWPFGDHDPWAEHTA